MIRDHFELLLFLTGVVATGIHLWWRTRMHKAAGPRPPENAGIRELPAIVEMLAREAENGDFVCLAVPNSALADGRPGEIQYTLVNHAVVLDWLLVSERNVVERKKFEQCTRNAGVSFVEQSNERVTYLRIENETPRKLADVGKQILQTVYHVTEAQELDVFAESPTWRKAVRV